MIEIDSELIYESAETTGIFLIIFIVIYIKWKLLKGIWTCGLGYALGFGVKWRPAPDNWAVITGGTDGIGLEYAKQLAKMGYSILILSRSEEKLKRVADNISNEFPQCKEVQILAVDFSRTDIYPIISDVINTLNNIDVLVNNVGIMCGPTAEYFTLIPPSMNDQYININIMSGIRMCEMILPIMVQQKRGIIINLSSICAEHLFPLLSVYCGTKAFNDVFSRGLALEYGPKGIVIQTVCPGPVSTNLFPDVASKVKNTKALTAFTFVNVKDFVSAAIKTVGIEWRTYGHWRHKLIEFVNVRITMILGRKIYGMMMMLPNKMMRNTYYKLNNINDEF